MECKKVESNSSKVYQFSHAYFYVWKEILKTVKYWMVRASKGSFIIILQTLRNNRQIFGAHLVFYEHSKA